MAESVALPSDYNSTDTSAACFPSEFRMTLSQLPTAYSESIERPLCVKCATQMMLCRIQPETGDFDKRTFECPSCAHEETWIVKLSSVSS